MTPDAPQPSGDGPRVIAWELTRRCSLRCRHCRGASENNAYSGELSTDECRQVIDSIGSFCRPVLIMTGGEPMMRPDLCELVRYASDQGLYPVLAPCGHLLTPTSAAALKEAGIQAISISLDGPDADLHDRFRDVEGAFARTLEGLGYAIDAGIPFQINTTITRRNVDQLDHMLDLAVGLGAKTLDLFFLVPTGRGAGLRGLEISAGQYEDALKWVVQNAREAPIRIKTTCAPHVARVAHQVRAGHGASAPGPPLGGCMAGRGFVFISHRGILQPCGFFAVPCGDVREANYDFAELYRTSPVFRDLRNADGYGGDCGVCEYRRTCGGCRARALEATGDYMAAEPRCSYRPGRARESSP